MVKVWSHQYTCPGPTPDHGPGATNHKHERDSGWYFKARALPVEPSVHLPSPSPTHRILHRPRNVSLRHRPGPHVYTALQVNGSLHML